MNNLLRTSAVLALAGLLASCASVIGPRQIELPLTKLQAGMDKRFPISNRVLEVIDIQLNRPQLSLAGGNGRVGVSLDAAVSSPFTRQSWRGSLAMSGRPYVDAARKAVLMAEPRVDRFAIDGVDDARRRQLASAANVLMNKVVADVAVYNFRPEDLRYAGVQFVPTRLQTTATSLIVTVEPVK
ncbi:DUF1439 domain-containing protein [Massilia violaceinigra]|uniref:DUF1439 domain-containing protein n=1 Tax=Massilia violaceinigra TaxID=2045208 RepID=A0ABY4AAL5_9BURK|nr:DUF1439 domain-containing protein [Massilia violaceinigra]UOD31849.1 DUF1439 domain-containing protein [Massilia violaceinigra]